jgi:proteic killer suppression protein
MIRGFRSKALAELWGTGRSEKIPVVLISRVLRRLDALNNVETLRELDIPGFHCHPLRGSKPVRYSLWVNGPWRLTFTWVDGEGPDLVDLEQYH